MNKHLELFSEQEENDIKKDIDEPNNISDVGKNA